MALAAAFLTGAAFLVAFLDTALPAIVRASVFLQAGRRNGTKEREVMHPSSVGYYLILGDAIEERKT